VVTQCIFAAPMILLYLTGILVAYLFGRPRRKPEGGDAA
jgi:Sec-independent protein secretion pathway component TatC